MRKLRREHLWPFVLALTITWCSGKPASLPSISFFQIDKLGHFVLYAVLATSLVRIDRLRCGWLVGGWWAALLTSAYGLGDEIRQSLTGGIRQYDLADWAADTLGAILATALYLYWSRYRRVLEMPLRRAKPKAEITVESPIAAADVPR
jgi:VanZ family protein